MLVLLVLAMVMLLALPASAANVFIDGKQLNVATSSENGSTLIALRPIFQALGAEVAWDGSTQTVSAVKGQTTVKLQIGSKTAYINGSPATLQAPGKVINGSTMVPLRFVSEALGSKVGWDQATQTVTITSAGGTSAVVATPPTAVAGDTKVHFIDVGQADSIYIQMPGNQDVLIDGGNVADGSTVVNYLKAQGVDDIELLIATHPHEDHIGGLPAVLDAFKVEKIVDSGYNTDSNISSTYQAKLKAEGAIYEADNKGLYTYGNNALQVLTGPETWQDVNDYSVVCRLDTGDIEFMFTGDAETPVESILSGQLDAEILKVGHHGSNSSTSPAFLNKVKPQVAVISVGTGNTYGHPTAETLQKLQNVGVKIYRTDLNGNIIVTTNGKTYKVTTQRNDSAPVSQPVAPVVQQPAQTQPTAPAVTTTGKYVGSKTSDKYHLPGCRYAEKITSENKIWFKDAADAISQGYEACGVCKP